MRVIAIDPCMRFTGVVYMDERRVICCKTIRFLDPLRQDQESMRIRAHSIASQIKNWIADKPYDAIVIEGFNYQKRHINASIFQTPYLCGFLASEFGDVNLTMQTSSQVLNTNAPRNVAYIKRALDRGYEIMLSDAQRLCTNDHLRSACAHGFYYLKNRGEL